MITQISNKIIPRNYFVVIAVFALVNILAINFFLQPYVTPFVSDSEQYVETAKYFKGEDVQIFGQRMLKPLMPFLAAAGSNFFGDIGISFKFINSILYFFIGFLVFKIIKLLFDSDKMAFWGSLLFLSAYPMLEYGIAVMTDISGWFFFVWSIYLTLLFLRQPSNKLIIFNALVSAAGSLTRESGIMGALFFIICLFFIFKGNIAQKLKYLFVFCAISALPFLAWQIFVYIKFHYTYYDWLFIYNKEGQPADKYFAQFFRVLIKSLAATFLIGWAFVVLGLAKIKEMSKDNLKIIAALILPSFSFIFWFAASSRLFYILGLLLCILACWGIISSGWLAKKYLLPISIAVILAGNYFWFIFDDKLRFILNSLLRITY